VRIIDRQTRTVVDPLSVSNLYLGRINERFPRVLDLVVGDPVQVEKLVKEILASLPEEFSLKQNYPNPFNPVTSITFDVAEMDEISLIVYDLMGKEVAILASGIYAPGRYQVEWNAVNNIGDGIVSGMYIYRYISSEKAIVRKMLYLK